MSRIAILSDIHANLPALEAVWADIKKQNVQAVYHLGDLVGYNPHPTECIDFVRTEKITGIVGNYDLAATRDIPDPIGTFLKPNISETGAAAYQWTRDRIRKEHKIFLLGLPERMELIFSRQRVVLVHGSPDSIREYLYPDTSQDHLGELVARSGARVLICGHTHHPMAVTVGEGLVLNPGSVGKPKDGDPRAGYLLLESHRHNLRYYFRRVEYPVAEVAREIRRVGLPEGQARSLETGTHV